MTAGAIPPTDAEAGRPSTPARPLLGDWRRWLWSLAATAPFWGVYVAHLAAAQGRLPTGFIQ